MNSFQSVTPEILPPERLRARDGGKEKDVEVLVYSEISPKGEVQLPCDSLDPLKRRILIAVHTYGINSHSAIKQIATFCDIPTQVIQELVEGAKRVPPNWLGAALSEQIVPCFTKPEIISRLCIEAENANSPKDRINSLTKLMEFRGLTAPEGGSKSFQRIAMRFKTS